MGEFRKVDPEASEQVRSREPMGLGAGYGGVWLCATFIERKTRLYIAI